MNQNDKPSSGLSFSASTPPAPLSRFLVRSYAAMPVPLYSGERPHDEFDGDVDIRAVGVGPLGARMVEMLARNLPGITCHEIVPDDERESSDDIAALLTSVQRCDLLFVLSGFDEDYCESVAQTVGRASCEAGVLTLVVTPRTGDIVPQCDGEHGKWYDTVFSVSDGSLPSQEDAITLRPESLIGYSMRHMVTVITNLITHRTGICIDFADITTIMKEGSAGRMGIGIASGGSRGATAVERAIELLERQGIKMSEATGVLASVHGSSQLTMADFDAACKVIHGQTSADANIIVGMISDDQMGSNVKVTVLTVHQCLSQSV